MKTMQIRAAAAACGVAAIAVSAAGRQETGPPYSPERSMQTMRLEEGFRIKLVASEPDIESPVAMDIDEDGRLFVVEMPGYPLDVSPSGRVKLLEDRDGDGRFERVTVFADNLVLPTGVMRWKRGILVTAAPDVIYFEDTNGDGRADVRKVVLTGFPFTNPQHTVNAPLYGLDNWIYLANQGPTTAVIYPDLFGDRGTQVTFPGTPDAPALDPPHSTVRFRPDILEVEAIAGESQFGHSFDAYGRYFGNDNSHHLWHEVLGARYLRRNPHLPIRRAMHDVPDHGAAAAIFPITERPTFELLTEAGEFTSACAPTIYLGGAFPQHGETWAFVAEPVHNLVHLDIVSPSGPTFTARRARPDREFLAAGDGWFRPVNLYVGPDGALYVVDYYRARIEHPEWTSSDLQRDPSALYEGRDRGRIYRIVHESQPRQARRARLAGVPTDVLVAALADPNAWWRRTAQRLLLDRRDPAAIAALRTMARERVSPLGRLHALWTLQGLGALDPALVAGALEDPEPGVRENAIVLAESTGSVERFGDRLAAMTSDPDPRVRLQVLASLGGLTSPSAVAAHEQLLFSHIDDRWMQLAALSVDSGRAMPFLERAVREWKATTGRSAEGHDGFIRQAGSIVAGRGRHAEIERAVSMAGADGGAIGADQASWRAALLEGLADGTRGRQASIDAIGRTRPRLLTMAADPHASIRRGALRLLALSGGVGSGPEAQEALARAERIATDPRADAVRRANAVGLLELDSATDRAALLQALVHPRQPEPVQVAAVRALGRRPGEAAGRFLLARWSTLTASVRAAAVDALLNDLARTWLLIAALRDGAVRPWTLSFWQKRDLLMHRDPKVRDAARAILEDDPARRQETFARYAAALALAGDPARGRGVFELACAQCHSIGGGDGALGPDLATVRHRPPLLLLADILEPSRSIAQGYETSVIERTSGDFDVGVLAAQSPTSITLSQGSGREITIPRDEIRKLTISPESSMPADLAEVVTPEQMADLLAYIRSGRTAE